MKDIIFDVIIVGGGIAGCATALSLCKQNKSASSIILDDANPLSFKIGESLPPESSRLLHYLHSDLSSRLSSDITAGKHLLCTGNASAWASTSLEERHAIMNPFGHGFHLDRAAFDEMLRSTVGDYHDNRVSVQGNCIMKGKFKAVEKDSANNWVVRADVGGKATTFYTKWVIDATGRKASLATKLGARTITSDPLLAFYALFTGPPPLDSSETDNDHRTLIEATPHGWFYSALLSLNPPTRVVAFHTLPTHHSAKLARRPDGFLDLLHASSLHISLLVTENGYEIMPGFPRCTAAGSSYLDQACDPGDRWIAVGDAAIAFDPISSQGMMTALEMGCYVGTVLAQQVASDERQAEVGVAVGAMYVKLREEYEKHRAYYYSAVKRFRNEEFWKGVGHSIVHT